MFCTCCTIRTTFEFGWVGKNLEVGQIGIQEKSVHPVNHCFDAKMKSIHVRN